MTPEPLTARAYRRPRPASAEAKKRPGTRRGHSRSALERDPLWYKDAVIYELHVRAFADSNEDGKGDFKGLTARLDYLQDLGVTAVWILPFYPSPLRDNGYDIADYTDVHEDFGTLKDFKEFLNEAHRRGIRVITELVINHTSDQHPWFRKSRQAARGTKWRDFYVWSDSPDRYSDTRIIFQDFEHSNWTWDPEAKAYYWHRFYSHQPDLNFDNPAVHDAVLKAMDFWFGLGVDGMRLDAIPYLYEREGTTCENLPETHGFLKKLRRHVDEKWDDRMLLAEANQWPEDAVSYFGDGDECHMNFHFPLMPRMFMSLRMEDRFPVVDILQQTPDIPDNCQWANFLRNHDELTLEMVTDEERDYMYRMYAGEMRARLNLGIRRRLAPLLGNNRRMIELMNGLLFSLPGTPVLYYGDEIGMGDNIYLGDRDGVRTPIQWSPDRNAGFSRANPQKLYLPVIIDPEYHFEALNIEAQQNNTHSLLWWMKQIIALRKRYRAFSRGTIEFLHPENRKVLSFVRRNEDETILVVANLSRFAECVELDLSEFKETVPLELFGRKPFPPIGDLPYFITLGPHSFFYFKLEPQRRRPEKPRESLDEITTVRVSDGWQSLFRPALREEFEKAVPDYLRACRWYAGKTRTIKACDLSDAVPVEFNGETYVLALVHVEYTDGPAESYLLPLGYSSRAGADHIARDHLRDIVARLEDRATGEEGVVYDAVVDQRFCAGLLDAIGRLRRFRSIDGNTVQGRRARGFRRLAEAAGGEVQPQVLRAEQSNTSIVFGKTFILKLFRKIESGVNPELEISRFLTRAEFPNSPELAGHLDHVSAYSARPTTLAILHRYVPNEGDAWRYTRDQAVQYLENVLARLKGGESARLTPPGPGHDPLLKLAGSEPPALARELFGYALDAAGLLGRRTAEMHIALSSRPGAPDFELAGITPHYQRSLFQSMRNLATKVFDQLSRAQSRLPEGSRERARRVLSLRADVLERFDALRRRRISAKRIRHHGDYHLGQVLYTGKDFEIIDYEGEPARPMSERRFKRAPFRDVAGMLRSYHYAAHVALHEHSIREEDRPLLVPWMDYWLQWVSAAFVRSYLETARGGRFLPTDETELQILLDAFALEKAIYELGYELGSRPDWADIPMEGILRILGPEKEGADER